MFHGFVIAKKDVGSIKEGQEGILTAYYPHGDDDPVAAVYFGEKTGGWLTYKWPEIKFLEHFEVDKEVEDV